MSLKLQIIILKLANPKKELHANIKNHKQESHCYCDT